MLLAEAVFGAFYAADAAGARDCGERARALVERQPDARTSFFALIADGIAGVLTGDGQDGAPSIRAALEALERADELRERSRALLAWAAMGPLWLREADLDQAVVERALATAGNARRSASLPHLLAHVAIERADD